MTKIVKAADAERLAVLKAVSQGKVTWGTVIGLSQELTEAIALIGCDLAASGQLDEARIVFEGLVAANPNDAHALAALGTVLQKLGRQAEAERNYLAALKVDPQNVSALTNLGELEARTERDGRPHLEAAAKADPQGTTSAGRRARLLLQALATA